MTAGISDVSRITMIEEKKDQQSSATHTLIVSGVLLCGGLLFGGRIRDTLGPGLIAAALIPLIHQLTSSVVARSLGETI